MLQVVAGRAPNTISRPCRDRKEAEQWAAKVLALGFEPARIDCSPFPPEGAKWPVLEEPD